MGARDDDDIRKYMPDLKTIARTADPALAEERYREAINNPELDRALDDLRQGNEPGRAPFEFPMVVAPPRQAEAPAPGPAAPVVPVAPVAAAKVAGGQTGAGPARGGAARVDVATPERPAATPPGAARGSSRDAAPPLRDRRRGTSRRRIAVLLAVAVLGPLATHQVFSRLRRSEAPVASVAPVASSGAMTASGRPSAEAAAAAGASAGAPTAAEPGTRPAAPPAVDAGASDEASPPKTGASDEAPSPKAGTSAEVPPQKAGASARPAVPAPRAPAGARPPPAEVSPAPPEIAADIMH
ncbi:hypothetical protein [Sorangium sp. So ce124]|uniref:hypothetical protein n=1 Tax=Sorangium sp. So ce124 TaxID=3133280 RepID=UPI003F6116EB